MPDTEQELAPSLLFAGTCQSDRAGNGKWFNG